MRNLIELEEVRDGQNRAYDAQNDSRNANGQFSTPNPLAKAIVRECFKQFSPGELKTVLEPACGSGSFISALLQETDTDLCIVGVDMDPAYLNIAKKCYGEYASLIMADYLSWMPDITFDLLVTNPPYVRHHLISADVKKAFQDKCKSLGINFSGLSDLYCYFIIKAMNDLSTNGLAAWLIPEEFLTVNYGQSIKRFLLESYSIPRIHVFASEDVKFDDALVSSCVLWVRKQQSDENTVTLFTYGPDIEHPEREVSTTKKQLMDSKKWGAFETESGQYKFKDLFQIKRGIATGANDFFIIDANTATLFNLPKDFLKPILPSARYVKTDHIKSNQDGEPSNTPFLYLIDCEKDETVVQIEHPELWEYLQSGIHLKTDSYICKNRKVWYWQDKREAPLFVVTYMGRGKVDASPFRFILNESKAIANNSFLMLYPTPLLAGMLDNRKITKEALLNILNAIPKERLVNGGRKYGGGLKKIEPKELGEIYLSLE